MFESPSTEEAARIIKHQVISKYKSQVEPVPEKVIYVDSLAGQQYTYANNCSIRTAVKTFTYPVL